MNFRKKLSLEALFPRNKIIKKMQNNLDLKIVSDGLRDQNDKIAQSRKERKITE